MRAIPFLCGSLWDKDMEDLYSILENMPSIMAQDGTALQATQIVTGVAQLDGGTPASVVVTLLGGAVFPDTNYTVQFHKSGIPANPTAHITAIPLNGNSFQFASDIAADDDSIEWVAFALPVT